MTCLFFFVYFDLYADLAYEDMEKNEVLCNHIDLDFIPCPSLLGNIICSMHMGSLSFRLASL